MFKKIIQKFISILQKIFVTLALFLIYIFAFGLTLIFIIFSKRGLSGKEKSYWKNAEGYEGNYNEYLRGS